MKDRMRWLTIRKLSRMAGYRARRKSFGALGMAARQMMLNFPATWRGKMSYKHFVGFQLSFCETTQRETDTRDGKRCLSENELPVRTYVGRKKSGKNRVEPIAAEGS
jgi:hypothetical protein